MADNTNQQTFPNSISQEELASRIAEEYDLPREEALKAQSVSTAIAGITDLYIRCWFIQQKRFADLMDYAQTRDSRFVKEANLQVGTMSHNSPAIVDLLLNAGEIA